MNKISDFGRALGEYFLGLETHRLYKSQRVLMQEYASCPEILKVYSLASVHDEVVDISGKCIANVIDLASIAVALIEQNPVCLSGIGIGEYVRWIMCTDQKQILRDVEILKLDTLVREGRSRTQDNQF